MSDCPPDLVPMDWLFAVQVDRGKNQDDLQGSVVSWEHCSLRVAVSALYSERDKTRISYGPSDTLALVEGREPNRSAFTI